MSAETSNSSIYIPLQFWFNNNATNLALPLIALQYHPITVSLTLANSSVLNNSSSTDTPIFQQLPDDYNNNYEYYDSYNYRKKQKKEYKMFEYSRGYRGRQFDDLRTLDCNGKNITELSPKIPPLLKTLKCGSNFIETIPKLPATLNYLECNNNLLNKLPELPSRLVRLMCSSNNIDELPLLPNKLRDIYISYNCIVELPPVLPPRTKVLYCSNNKLTALPDLPSKNLKYFDCSRNDIKYISEHNHKLLKDMYDNDYHIFVGETVFYKNFPNMFTE